MQNMDNQISNMTKAFNIGDCLFIISDSKLAKNNEQTWIKTIHSHPYFEIHFVIKGQLIYETPGNVAPIAENSVCIVPPKHQHRFLPFSGNTSRISIRIAFEKCAAEPEGIYDYIRESFQRIETAEVFSDETLISAFSNLSKINIWSNEPVEYCEAESLLRIIFLRLAEKCKGVNKTSKTADYTNPSDMVISSYIEHYIYYNYSNNPSAKLAAEYAHISVRQLERICKRLYNKSFKDLLSEYRMTIAKQLLAVKNLKLKDVAELTGFKSYDGFYKAWMNTYGSPPGKFKAKKQ